MAQQPQDDQEYFEESNLTDQEQEDMRTMPDSDQ